MADDTVFVVRRDDDRSTELVPVDDPETERALVRYDRKTGLDPHPRPPR